jgi:hypothetical protein
MTDSQYELIEMVPRPFSNTMALKINCVSNRPTRVPSEAGNHLRGRDVFCDGIKGPGAEAAYRGRYLVDSAVHV